MGNCLGRCRAMCSRALEIWSLGLLSGSKVQDTYSTCPAMVFNLNPQEYLKPAPAIALNTGLCLQSDKDHLHRVWLCLWIYAGLLQCILPWRTGHICKIKLVWGNNLAVIFFLWFRMYQTLIIANKTIWNSHNTLQTSAGKILACLQPPNCASGICQKSRNLLNCLGLKGDLTATGRANLQCFPSTYLISIYI